MKLNLIIPRQQQRGIAYMWYGQIEVDLPPMLRFPIALSLFSPLSSLQTVRQHAFHLTVRVCELTCTDIICIHFCIHEYTVEKLKFSSKWSFRFRATFLKDSPEKYKSKATWILCLINWCSIQQAILNSQCPMRLTQLLKTLPAISW